MPARFSPSPAKRERGWGEGVSGRCEKRSPHPALRASLSRYAGEGLVIRHPSGAPVHRPGALATAARPAGPARPREVGRASCRERVGTYVSISGGAVYLKKKL